MWHAMEVLDCLPCLTFLIWQVLDCWDRLQATTPPTALTSMLVPQARLMTVYT